MAKLTIFATMALFVFCHPAALSSYPTFADTVLGAAPNDISFNESEIARDYIGVDHQFTQRVDNFDPQNPDTFQQRFSARSSFYQAGGPIIIIVDGLESRYWSHWNLNYTLAAQMASQSGGMLFNLEHRYFGASRVMPDRSVQSKRFLSPDQALADLAHFIEYIKSNTTVLPSEAQQARVVLVGRGYGGSLAVWFRQKYPHLADAAWASSAPVLAQPNNADYKELAASTFLQMAGPECYDRLDEGFEAMEQIAAAGDWVELQRQFNICEPLRTESDVSYFFLSASQYFTAVSTMRPLVGQLCADLLHESNASPLEAIKRALGIREENEYCWRASYTGYIQSINNENDYRSDYRNRVYLQCSQLGGFHTTDSPNQPFGSRVPMAFFAKMCSDSFGSLMSADHLQEAADRLNVLHGGLRPQVSNVLFTFGNQDSGRSLQITEELGNGVRVLEVPEAAAAYDFYEPNEEYDSAELQAIKHEIVEIVQSWL